MTQQLTEKWEAFALPKDFVAAGLSAGIKSGGRKDMALLVSLRPAQAAGVFTTNQVQAAPVKWSRRCAARGQARAIVVNSGNANACNGAQGMADAERMARLAAERLNLNIEDVLVCSTGHIGWKLPMDRIEDGVARLVASLTSTGGREAAEAILTTDKRPKTACVEIKSEDGAAITVSGMAKGAGMIHPHMATMLAFLTTDAAVEPGVLQAVLSTIANATFNRITVEGDTSTNDTCLLLANGAAGNAPLAPGRPGWEAFQAALEAVAASLARRIIEDAEGATRVVTVKVDGARNDAQADAAARAVAHSVEIKASWQEAVANWGRVMDALGYSSAEVVEEKVDILYNGTPAALGGQAAKTDDETLKQAVGTGALTVEIQLNLGAGKAEILTCDLTEEYIRLNRY